MPTHRTNIMNSRPVLITVGIMQMIACAFFWTGFLSGTEAVHGRRLTVLLASLLTVFSLSFWSTITRQLDNGRETDWTTKAAQELLMAIGWTIWALFHWYDRGIELWYTFIMPVYSGLAVYWWIQVILRVNHRHVSGSNE